MIESTIFDFIQQEVESIGEQFASIDELIDYLHSFQIFHWLLADVADHVCLNTIEQTVAEIVESNKITLDNNC